MKNKVAISIKTTTHGVMKMGNEELPPLGGSNALVESAATVVEL